MLEDALGPDPSSAAKVNAGATNPQPAQPGQPGPWPGQPGPWPGQPGQPGPWPGQPGQPGPWPGQPGQPGPWPGQPGQPGPWPGQPGPWPGQPGQPGPWPGQPGQPGPWPGQPGQPGPWPGQPGPAAGPLTLPFEIPTQGGWIPMKLLTVEGTINMNIDKFTIDVFSGQNIVFHFNVRFREGGNHQAVVRNSKIKDVWGNEERAIPNFPFRKGEHFEILILGEPEQYKVAVNKQHFLEFKHRYKSLREVTKVSVYGDITLHKMFMV
ncbi:galectin-3b isoform X2 [Mobula birostris]|uniref:galectin-3b isoform X2 n=1 Tax=Mobula birostris TaxID=1983395 RepID=UPI003B28CFFE